MKPPCGYEAAMIEGALAKLNWNQTKTAEELKISRRTLIEKMQRYEIRRGPKTGLTSRP